MRIVLEKNDNDPTEAGEAKLVWEYDAVIPYGAADDFSVRLVEFRRDVRASRRHKWKRDDRYEGWRRRAYSYSIHDFGWRRPAADTPPPPGGDEAVIVAAMARCKVAGAFDPPKDRGNAFRPRCQAVVEHLGEYRVSRRPGQHFRRSYEKAQCERAAAVGDLCRQHHGIQASGGFVSRAVWTRALMADDGH